MNKKFSTLVASLLFASAFSAYAGSPASMFMDPTAVVASTRTTVKEVETDLTAQDDWDAASAANVVGQTLPKMQDNSRLYVIEKATVKAVADQFLTYDATFKGDQYAPATAKTFYWSVTADGQLKNQNGDVLNVGGKSNFEIVPVKDDGNITNETVNGSFFALAVRTETGLAYVEYGSSTFSISTNVAADFDYSTNIATAALFSPIETEFATAATDGDKLNEELSGGFNLSIASAVKDVTISGADMFKGKLTAMEYDGTTDPSKPVLVPAKSGTASYYLKAANGEYIYFDADADAGSGQKGLFKTAKAAKVLALGGVSDDAYKFEVFAADNGSEAVQVKVDSKRLYIQRTGKNGVLSASATSTDASAWAVTSLGASNMADFKTFLTGQFYKVSFVKRAADADPDDAAAVAGAIAANAYKINGVLGLRYNTTATAAKADYVKAADVVAEDPSTMWAPSIAADGKLVLTNRENTDEEVTIASLREVSAGVYEVGTVTGANVGIAVGEQVKITPVASVTKTDGYKVYADNVLINSTFYLGQSRRNADGDVPAYWAENHGTHQIGATVNLGEATKWNVQLVKKGTSSQIDSVLVVSDLVSYNATTGVTTTTKDTLAVLPYVFQNRDNREYVKLNDEAKLEYYICDKDNNQAKDNGSAQIFALKKRPGNTYNYVTLDRVSTAADKDVTPVSAIDGEFKVYLKNSASKGTWENVETYSDDANSLMVVDPIDAPEYRKVKKDWGDIVKIYREEYPTEVLFEKRDAKSVVEKDTLSFLNVNNSVTGANPALFVDTAYVNRTVNGVDNTCYQYLLAVNVDKDDTYHCPLNPLHDTQAWRDEFNGGKPCPDAVENPAVVKGRFLINLIDTAYAYKQDHLHNNPYINMVEADENKAKLSFVEGIHVNDTLYITRKGGEVVKLAMDDPNFNVAKFAFRYVNNADGSFKIQTQYKNYEETTLEKFEKSADNNGYLRWVNGTIVVTDSYTNGETFNMEENFDGEAVANEDVTVSSIKVVATDGAVIIKGAEGKKVVISNVLGQTVANAVISSNEAKISAPAGVVVVAVEGEAAVKAIVK
nr:DUF6383 domain-containing protein [Parabacteroides goldsteinii]